MQRSSSSEKSKKESLNDVLQKEMFLMNLTLTHGKMNRGRELASVLIIGLGHWTMASHLRTTYWIESDVLDNDDDDDDDNV